MFAAYKAHFEGSPKLNETTTPITDDTTMAPLENADEQRIQEGIEQVIGQINKHIRKGDIPPTLMKQALTHALSDALRQAAAPATLDFSVRDLLGEYWTQVRKRRDTASTGFAQLNEILSGGIEAKRLVVVLGAPNTGKTTFVHQISDHVADSGRPVLYVTSEDGPSELMAKTLARIGSINYTAVLKGYESEEKKINLALTRQQDRLSTDRLRYLDASSGITMDIIREKAREHFTRYDEAHGGGPGVLVVDYLQRVARSIKARSSLSSDLREVVTMLTEQLRALANELNCGVIVIASQHRGGYKRGEDSSSLASAKESGDIEYTADVLMALSEDDKRMAPMPMTAVNLFIDKNRQGKKSKSIAFDFWPDRQQFTEVAK